MKLPPPVTGPNTAKRLLDKCLQQAKALQVHVNERLKNERYTTYEFTSTFSKQPCILVYFNAEHAAAIEENEVGLLVVVMFLRRVERHFKHKEQRREQVRHYQTDDSAPLPYAMVR